MRDNNFTDKQIRGIDLTIKAASKKFPFIKGWDFSNGYEQYQVSLYLDLYVDLDELKEYAGEKEVKEYYRNSEKFGAILSPFDWGDYGTDEWQAFADKSYELSQKINDYMNNFYSSLPEDYIINWVSQGFYGDQKNIVTVKADYFIPR
mgnify:CR=1 FL=1